MKNLKFLENQLKANNIKYEKIEYIENKFPTYWVDLKVTFEDFDEYEIFRLSAYNKQDYKKANYNRYIMEKVQELKEILNEYERVLK